MGDVECSCPTLIAVADEPYDRAPEKEPLPWKLIFARLSICRDQATDESNNLAGLDITEVNDSQCF